MGIHRGIGIINRRRQPAPPIVGALSRCLQEAVVSIAEVWSRP
jgi:hypothetical protein